MEKGLQMMMTMMMVVVVVVVVVVEGKEDIRKSRLCLSLEGQSIPALIAL
jgi:hypothetical protein